MISDNWLKLEYHAGFKKLEQWIMKSRHSKWSFALNTHKSEINLNNQGVFPKPA